MTIYGVDDADLGDLKHPFAALAETPEEWRVVFNKTLQSIRTFLARHDGIEVLAKCAHQVMVNAASKRENPRWALEKYEPHKLIEPAELEIIQALVLMQTSPRKSIPASPGRMDRFLPEIPKCTYAFSRMQPLRYPDDPEREHLLIKIRMQTIFYRNLFVKQDCESVVQSIFRHIDDLAFKALGFAFSEMFAALLALATKVEQRLNEYQDRVRDGLQAACISEALKSIEFFCAISPMASRVWAKCKKRCITLDDFRWSAFQLSELCYAWPYVLDRAELQDVFGEVAVAFFERISFRLGQLAAANPEHLFMKNPIWCRPFIALDDCSLFLPLPNLFYGFPFQIFEQFLAGQPALEQAYSDARATFLEDTIGTHVTTGMPSARTYRRVMWRDDTTGALYENDLVAIIGNTVFLFEAKSGKLSDVARRGGELSLIRNCKELFVEPGEQARRLENYLNTKGDNARLWIKETGETVCLNLGRPKVVHKFSICIEHFGTLTSAKHNLKILGIIKDESAWSPVLSLGELLLIWRYLDTEVSFFHYLTRRATLEELVDFEGDEQDILSMYLINGLCIDPDKVQGRQLRFLNIDGIVRAGKTPRRERSEFEVFGVPLDYYWRSTLQEIYRDASLRHRFDILQVVLNQDPHSLAGITRHVQKWRRGLVNEKKGDLLLARNKIGKRVFVLAYQLLKRPITAEEWTERSRTIARSVAAEIFEATDCAVILRIKKSKESTYDGLSFHRLGATHHDRA